MSEAACLHMQHDQWGFCTECGADIYQQDEATQVRSRHLVPEWLIGGSVADGEGGVIGKLRMTTWPSDNPEGDWILMDPDERDEWCEWFERHGIDPDGVAVPGSVVADDATRRISYVAWEKGEITRVGRVVQLEARALPFPPPSAEWSSPETGV